MTGKAGGRVVQSLSDRARNDRQTRIEWEKSEKPYFRVSGGVKELGSEKLDPVLSLGNTDVRVGSPIDSVMTSQGRIQDTYPRFEPGEVQPIATKIWFSQNYEQSLIANSGAAIATVSLEGSPSLESVLPITGIGSVSSDSTGGLLVSPRNTFGKFVRKKSFSISFKFRTSDTGTPNPLLSNNPLAFEGYGGIDFILENFVTFSGTFLGLSVFIRTNTVTQFRSVDFLPQDLNDNSVHSVELARRGGAYTLTIDGSSESIEVDNFDYSLRNENDFPYWGILLNEGGFGSATIDDVLIKLL